ncbi:hypothetical protein [Dyella sedimenti]|uniref:hypothetical protein n=1 Tax=Dyella sedimenti TaxID=2919947 RepID=UPI001FA9DD12|nr:hypothetical protein [Dyella sedimenti]
MSDSTREPREGCSSFQDELLHLLRLLATENELLRHQLRRHSAGELQIRDIERRMCEVNGGVRPATQERLRALLASLSS